MISVLNFKKFNKGSIRGFLDLRYHGFTIKGCRLMQGNSGMWFSFPQMKGEDNDGSAQYYDIMFLTTPEREYVRTLILAELESQGAIERPKGNQTAKRSAPEQRRGKEIEDLSAYNSNPDGDDIPFCGLK